jgi:CheY-like chemotaxis protein
MGLMSYFKLGNNKDIEFEYVNKNEPKELILYSDKVRFRQVFTNLLNNAFKYTEKGYIKFGYEAMEKQVRFFVSDTGIGLESSEVNKIFDHFYKVEKNENRLYRGIGLGLAICKKIIEMIGGEIWVDSVYGQGSTFYFTLPYKSEGPIVSKDKNKDHNKQNLDKITILVAEDDPTNYELVKSMLKSTGAQIIWAQNGQQAIDFINLNPSIEDCIVLMDIKMPVLNGYEANRQIKAINKKIPIIAVTAYAQAGDKEKILNEKFDDYIAKPIRVETLLMIIYKYAANIGLKT